MIVVEMLVNQESIILGGERMNSEWQGFIKYPKIKVLGADENKFIFSGENEDIVVEEKVDGANTRFFVKNGKVYVGSRNVVFGDAEEKKDEVGRYEMATKLFLNRIKGHEKEYDGLIFFGETMIKHTIDYDWVNIPSIIMFDIYDVKKGRFLNYHEKVRIFGKLKLPDVRLVGIFKSEEMREKVLNGELNDDFVPKSAYYNGYAEGVVFKNYKQQVFAKLVRSEFREKNKMAFGASKKQGKNDEERLLFEYVTNARIEKQIFKMIDEGWDLDMKMMKELPIRVLNDVIEEEGKDIFGKNYVIDFRKFRKLISKRCVEVLKQVIHNNINMKVK